MEGSHGIAALLPSLNSEAAATMSVSSSSAAAASVVAAVGESDSYYSAEIPWWAQWISTVILSLTFIIGLPLNGATVLIFCRRKKLRHLVNFVLLLDCLSHIAVCLFCIPLHLVTEWSGSSSFLSILPSSLGIGNLAALANFQHVIGNFVNLYSTFLTVSIAILRYRRLCWKKKDKFSTMNALKWSVISGILAIGMICVQSYVVMTPEMDNAIAIVYLAKISLILLAVVTVFFCYIRVSQRVWANTANQEKTMDPAKLKKSRSVHLKATIHSCVQIVLVITTVAPHLYLQAIEMLSASGYSTVSSSSSSGLGVGESHQASWSDGGGAAPVPHQEQLLSVHPLLLQNHPQEQIHYQHEDISRRASGGWLQAGAPLPFASSPHHKSAIHESLSASASGVLHSTLEKVISNTTSSGDTFGSSAEKEEKAQGIPIGIAATAAAAATLTFGASQVARLIAVTLNYALLALGTPCAYIASCHRFREQFTSILFSHVPNSPQNSTYHHGHHNHSSPSHKANHHHRDRFHYHHRSTTGGTQDACFSSPLTRVDTRTSTTALQNNSSLMSRASYNGRPSGAMGIARESVSISISANTRSSFSHSFKSRSSIRKGSIGSSMKRRISSSGGLCGSSAGIGGSMSGCGPSGCATGSKSGGLLGVSIAADSVFMESDSALISEHDTSNERSSSTGNLTKPSPSPTAVGPEEYHEEEEEEDQVSGRGSSGELVVIRKNSSSCGPTTHNHLLPAHLTAVTTITSCNSSNLNTYLQSYGDYECGTDLGQLV